jgi:F-type H+-transporting ATPase subunit gamma
VRFLFEPSIEDLVKKAEIKLRLATFEQQALDARLAQYAAQMMGMQNASENAKGLIADLTHEYNKQRRKIIDKKISEVFAGSALW